MGIRKIKEYDVEIINCKVGFEYCFLDIFEVGIMLYGMEVKFIWKGNVNFWDVYCFFRKGELYIKSFFIVEYEYGNMFNYEFCCI